MINKTPLLLLTAAATFATTIPLAAPSYAQLAAGHDKWFGCEAYNFQNDLHLWNAMHSHNELKWRSVKKEGDAYVFSDLIKSRYKFTRKHSVPFYAHAGLF
jgi:GH35 family endo-1,4-beta-xylanase